MNFLAHARASLHDPWLLAGVCLPDWLRVLDRRSRVDLARPHPDEEDERVIALRTGVKRHIHDDEWFHTSEAFAETTREIARHIRAAHPGIRGSFYAHILLEVLLDAELMNRDPALCDRFYDAVAALSPEALAEVSRPLVRSPEHIEDRVPEGLRRFSELRFIERYETDAGVLMSLRGVTQRVLTKRGRGMRPLPDAFTDTIAWARAEVRAATDSLLEAP